ncbi:APC family permease [Arthrobacter sp. D2-10]
MVTSASLAPSQHRLSGRLGVGAIIFMVVAAAAPLTVVAGTVPLGIANGNGASYPAAYLICTIILLAFAVGFTAMSRSIPDAGAFASYIGAGIGKRVGTGAALLAVASYSTIQLAILGFAGPTVAGLVASYGGPDLQWWTYSLALLALTAFLGYRNIELSGKILGLLLIAEVVVVLVLDIVVIARGGGPEGLSTTWMTPGAFFEGAPGIALIFAVNGYFGFEAAVIFRDEARNPERTIPRATYGALMLVGAFYAISSWAIISAWGDGGAVAEASTAPDSMVIATVVTYLGSVAGDIVLVLLTTSLFAAILSFHNVISRYLFDLGRTSLPGPLNHSHSRHGSPHVASTTTSLLGFVLLGVCALFGMDPILEIFTWFVGIGAVGLLTLMLLTCIAIVAFFRRNRRVNAWHGIVAPLLGGLGLAWLLGMTLANLPLLIGGSWALAGVLSALLVLIFVLGVMLPHRALPVTSEG